MMPGNTFSKGQKIKAGIILVLVALSICYFASILVFQHQRDVKRIAPDSIIEFSGLPENVAVEATLQMNGAVTPLPMAENKLPLSPPQKEKFALPYQIKASLRMPDDTYRDFLWTIDERGVEYSILVDGFSSKDTISLSLDGQTSLDIPFDWSGRIKLEAMLIIAKDTRVCIEIFSSGKRMDACHIVTGKKGA